MATPLNQASPEELQKLMDQLQEAQRLLDQKTGKSSLPSNLNAAQLGGASGVGFEDAPTQSEISGQVAPTIEAGGSKSQAGDSINPNQARNLVVGRGLEGLFDPESLAGLTVGEASRLVAQARAKRMADVTANTSYAYNPETLKSVQREIDKLGFALNDVNNNPFEPKEFKDQSQKGLIDTTGREIGKLFDSPDQLYFGYQTDPQMKAMLDNYIQKGGTLEGVAKNITAPVTNTNVQDPASYLASLSNPAADKQAEKMALNELAPESAIAQDEIARNARIPQELKTLYFGDEKTIGLLQMKKEQASEQIRIIEERERDDKVTARAKANLAIERNNAEADRQIAQIEENRLQAKNYITARLAKLGALTTTGKAPVAIKTLDQKYQMSIDTLKSNYKFANREIEINLNDLLSKIENDTDENILSIQEDLTKTGEEVAKEVLKAQQAADKQIYTITEKYARRLRERTTKYTDDLKKAAEKYAKEFSKAASAGIEINKLASTIGEGAYVKGKGVLLPTGAFSSLRLTPSEEQEVQSAGVLGDKTIRYFVSLPATFRSEFIQRSLDSGRSVHSIDAVKSEYEQWKKEQEKSEKGGDIEIDFDKI